MAKYRGGANNPRHGKSQGPMTTPLIGRKFQKSRVFFDFFIKNRVFFRNVILPISNKIGVAEMANNWTQQNLDDLNAAIASGAKSVSINGETTVFRDLDEINQLRLEMQQSIESATGNRQTQQYNMIRVRSYNSGFSSYGRYRLMRFGWGY